jgi:hypothetical protein
MQFSQIEANIQLNLVRKLRLKVVMPSLLRVSSERNVWFLKLWYVYHYRYANTVHRYAVLILKNWNKKRKFKYNPHKFANTHHFWHHYMTHAR